MLALQNAPIGKQLSETVVTTIAFVLMDNSLFNSKVDIFSIKAPL